MNKNMTICAVMIVTCVAFSGCGPKKSENVLYKVPGEYSFEFGH